MASDILAGLLLRVMWWGCRCIVRVLLRNFLGRLIVVPGTTTSRASLVKQLQGLSGL